MSNFTKTAAAVLALGSSAVFAGTMGPVCAPGAVTVPCESTAWDFGAYALYLHHASNRYTGFTTTSSGTFDETRFNDFNYRWGWGFKIEGSYHFSTGNDINVNWYHWEKSRDFDILGLNLGLISPILPLSGFIDVQADFKPQWDAVNFEFGQRVNFGEHKVIRFHGGAQWARVERSFEVDIRPTQSTPIETPFSVDLDASEKFNGFGPRVGMDMSYHFGNGFAIYANGASALLVGRSRFDVSFVNNLPPVASASVSGRKDSVVPELEAKLGVTYNYAMGNGDLILDVGYMVVDYINAVQFIAPADDFSLQGLIFGAKWIGNVA